MKILVTGASGFIGSHTAEALTAKGHAVTTLDAKPSSHPQNGQTRLVGDILDPAFVRNAAQGMDAVYHFAGIADIDECLRRPVDVARINILGTVELLDACRLAGVGRFVFASSAYVYGDAGYFYRTSKRSCEQFIEDYHEAYGLEYTCLRYGSLYGERADNRNSIYRILRQALECGHITYRGTGDELREFIHVRDAAEISVDILDREYANECVTITGAEKLKYSDLLLMIQEIMGNRIQIHYEASTRKAHYKITPYNFTPKLGRKISRKSHIDMGQGILFCLAEIFEQLHATDAPEDTGLLQATPVNDVFRVTLANPQ
ncbi:MAG: NAD(P)-dependent oxidoreductase [Desulfovibrio sp.]|jgi:UDP-glucose 4-epimerase|nr:NAD(P)-dependent oxidoreductase [Desulfovibrio sp.]